MKKKHKLIFALILSLGILLRIYKLYDRPYGIHIDEAGMYADAINLVENGTDRYNHQYPVYLQNFGGGQSVLYAYFTSFLIKILPNSYLLIRIPSVIFGTLLIIYGYLIGKELLNKKHALIIMLMISVCPYFIQASRIGLDCNLLLPLLTISTYYLIKAIKQNKNKIYILSGILFGITLYTYALSYLIIPLFLIITLSYLIKHKKINIKNILSVLIPSFILAVPLILFLLVNYNIIPEFTFIKSDMYKLPYFRGNELSILNIINNFDIITMILTGDGFHWNSNIMFGTITYTLVPIFIYGITLYIIDMNKNRGFDLSKIIFFIFISTYVIIMLTDSPNINKTNSIYFSIIYFIIYGLIKIKPKFQKILITIFIINSILFYNSYLNRKIHDPFYFNASIYDENESEYMKNINPEIYKLLKEL